VFSIPLVELEERRRGLAKLNAAYKALTDEFGTEEGPSHFDIWGEAIEHLSLRIDSLAAEVTTAKSLAERLAPEAREKEVSHRYGNVQSLGSISASESLYVLVSKKRKPAPIECSISPPGQS